MRRGFLVSYAVVCFTVAIGGPFAIRALRPPPEDHATAIARLRQYQKPCARFMGEYPGSFCQETLVVSDADAKLWNKKAGTVHYRLWNAMHDTRSCWSDEHLDECFAGF